MSDETLVLTARSIDDLLGLVPHVLGFHPAESLVMVLVEAGRVVVTARVDVADATAPGVVADLMARMRARFPSSFAWCIAYSADARAAWHCLRFGEQAAPSAVLGVVHVDGTSWRLSPGGPAHTYAPHINAASQQAEQAGMPAQASRACLVAGIDGPPSDRIPEAENVLARERDRLARSSVTRWPAMMRRALASAPVVAAPSRELCARLALLAQHPGARDAALLALTPANASWHAVTWQHVVRQSPRRYQPHPLGLLGIAAWVSGNGALQSICRDRLRALDPEIPLFAVLTGITEAVLPPSAWPAIRRDLARHMRDGPRSSATISASIPKSSTRTEAGKDVCHDSQTPNGRCDVPVA